MAAATSNDLATLSCLRRLGCPWGPDGAPGARTFTEAVKFAALEVLSWLHAEGCPVDWQQARAAAQWRMEWTRKHWRSEAVLSWVEGQMRAGGILPDRQQE